jgi:hypothetical protein
MVSVIVEPGSFLKIIKLNSVDELRAELQGDTTKSMTR